MPNPVLLDADTGRAVGERFPLEGGVPGCHVLRIHGVFVVYFSYKLGPEPIVIHGVKEPLSKWPYKWVTRVF